MSTRQKQSKTSSTTPAAVADHLAELRVRLAWVGLAFVVFSSLAYNFREALISIVLSPLGDEKLVYLTPAGGFTFIIQITMYAGILVTAPLAVYHLYKFISPAFARSHQRRGLRVVLASSLLMVAGVSFGYFVAIPAALRFLTQFAGDFVQPNLTADSYLGFVVAYVLGLGLLFQLPLLLLLINWIRPFQKGDLIKTQQYVLVGAFIAAALITPTPDMLNQTMVALPIIFIYQFGVIAVAIINRRSRKQPNAVYELTHEVIDVAPEVHSTPTPVSRPVITAVMATAAPAPVQPKPVQAMALRTRRSVDGFQRRVPASAMRVGEISAPRPISRQQPAKIYQPTRQMSSLSLDGMKN